MHDKVTEFIELRAKFEALHTEVYDLVSESHKMVQQGDLALGDLVDMGLLCREMESFMEEVRKEVKARKELCGKILALGVAKQAMEDPSKLKDTITGELGTGRPDVKQQPKLPKKSTPEYTLMMRSLGLSDEVIGKGCVSPSWKGMVEYISELAEQGKPLPPGVESSYPIYTTTFRRRKNRSSRSNDHG